MEPEETLEDTSPRADLEAAFEHHEKLASEEGGSEQNTQEPVRPAEQEAAPSEGGTPESEGKSTPKPEDKSLDSGAKPEKPESPNSQAASEIKPPIGWKAVAKQEWAKIPKAAQEEILRRETETTKALSTSVNARKLFEEFNQTVAPFMPLIRAQNSSPMAAVKNLMTTAAGLTVGSPEQKARIIAEMIGNFGIDIESLDKILAANPPKKGGAAGTSELEVALQRHLAPVHDFMNGIKQTQQQREAQMAQEAEESVAAFADKNEFFEELREDIADYMELSARRGRTVTLDQAYKFCVAQNPEISAIVEQRRAAAAAKQQNRTVQQARKAASSVSGVPNAAPQRGTEPNDRRGDIAAAWDELSAT